jgi:hypothetical protein
MVQVDFFLTELAGLWLELPPGKNRKLFLNNCFEKDRLDSLSLSCILFRGKYKIAFIAFEIILSKNLLSLPYRYEGVLKASYAILFSLENFLENGIDLF